MRLLKNRWFDKFGYACGPSIRRSLLTCILPSLPPMIFSTDPASVRIPRHLATVAAIDPSRTMDNTETRSQSHVPTIVAHSRDHPVARKPLQRCSERGDPGKNRRELHRSVFLHADFHSARRENLRGSLLLVARPGLFREVQ